MGRRRGSAVVLLAAFVLTAFVSAACGDDAGPPADPGTSSTSVPSTTVSSTTVSSTGPTVTVPPSTLAPTTTVPARPRVVQTRNPVPADAKRFVVDGEVFHSAIVLPDGSVLLAFRSSQFDLCSARIDRVDPATGARSRFVDGAEPQVSPDGRFVAYAARGERDREGTCSIVDIGLYDLATETDQVVRLEPASGGAVAVRLRWSPDSRQVAAIFGFDYSETTGSGVFEVATKAMTVLQVGPELTSRLNGMAGTRADALWTPWPVRWLSDNTLVVSATCCYGESYDETSVPRWWAMPANGSLDSLDDAIADPALLAQLPEVGFG